MAKLTLTPEDYIVFNGGLKIANIGKDVITLDLPKSYSVKPMIIKQVVTKK